MSDRRRAILDTAQSLFLEKGYAATSISDIREASGASVGSIYHFFGNKEGIAAALVERAVARWTEETEAQRRGDSFESLIRATVEGLLVWGRRDPDGFRIMDELRHIGKRGRAGDKLAALLRQGEAQSRAALEAQADAGEIRPLPWPLGPAVVLGPAYEYLRICQLYPAEGEFVDVVRRLSDAAWAAVVPE